jgi:hypothetical protein
MQNQTSEQVQSSLLHLNVKYKLKLIPLLQAENKNKRKRYYLGIKKMNTFASSRNLMIATAPEECPTTNV